ncbi:hypothetical protein AB2F28_06815 [Escherichia coli]
MREAEGQPEIHAAVTESVIDAISEGPIEGPVDGLKSVLLNSTPVLDSEGNTNIAGVVGGVPGR